MKKLLSALAITAVAVCAITPQVRAEDDAAKPKKEKKEKVDQFATMDTDGNGLVTKEEFTKSMKEKGKEEAEIEKMFEKKDTDKDGSISKEEMHSGKKGKKDGADKKEKKEKKEEAAPAAEPAAE